MFGRKKKNSKLENTLERDFEKSRKELLELRAKDKALVKDNEYLSLLVMNLLKVVEKSNPTIGQKSAINRVSNSIRRTRSSNLRLQKSCFGLGLDFEDLFLLYLTMDELNDDLYFEESYIDAGSIVDDDVEEAVTHEYTPPAEDYTPPSLESYPSYNKDVASEPVETYSSSSSYSDNSYSSSSSYDSGSSDCGSDY